MRKPKFGNGQVVVVKRGFMNTGAIFKITGKPTVNKEGDWEYPVAGMGVCVEWALRPLTKREAAGEGSQK